MRRLLAATAAALTLAVTPAHLAADSPDDYTLENPLGFLGAGFKHINLGPPPITRAQTQTYATILNLSDDQRALALDLQRQLETDHRNAWTELREIIADNMTLGFSAPDPDDAAAAQDKQNDATERFESRSAALAEAFFDDLRLVLSDSQEDNWDTFERARRRATTLTQSATYDDERFDLIAVAADTLTEPEAAAIDDLLDEYEVQLDAALIARNAEAARLQEHMLENSRLMQEAMRTIQTDPTAWVELNQNSDERNRPAIAAALDTRTAAARVRDTNRRYLTLVTAELPDDAAERLNNAVDDYRRNAQASPLDFSRMQASRARLAFSLIEHLPALDAMMTAQTAMFTGNASRAPLATPPLTPDQRRQIDDLREEYQNRLTAMERRHKSAGSNTDEIQGLTVGYPGGTATLTPKDEADNSGAFVVSMFGAGANDEDSAEHLRERTELDQWAIDSLRDVLTIEQRAAFAHF